MDHNLEQKQDRQFRFDATVFMDKYAKVEFSLPGGSIAASDGQQFDFQVLAQELWALNRALHNFNLNDNLHPSAETIEPLIYITHEHILNASAILDKVTTVRGSPGDN